MMESSTTFVLRFQGTKRLICVLNLYRNVHIFIVIKKFRNPLEIISLNLGITWDTSRSQNSVFSPSSFLWLTEIGILIYNFQHLDKPLYVFKLHMPTSRNLERKCTLRNILIYWDAPVDSQSFSLLSSLLFNLQSLKQNNRTWKSCLYFSHYLWNFLMAP